MVVEARCHDGARVASSLFETAFPQDGDALEDGDTVEWTLIKVVMQSGAGRCLSRLACLLYERSLFWC